MNWKRIGLLLLIAGSGVFIVSGALYLWQRLPMWLHLSAFALSSALTFAGGILVLVTGIRERMPRGGGPISPTCPSCGYSLCGNTSGVCPECGETVKPDHLMQYRDPKRRSNPGSQPDHHGQEM